MNKMIIAGVLLLAACILTAQPCSAYEDVTNTPSGGCLNCHTFAGPSGAQHSFHTAAPQSVACSSCHPGGTAGKNVTTDKCTVCHTGSPAAQAKCNLINLASHPKSGAQSCLACHSSQCAAPTTTTTVPSGAFCTDSDNDTYGDNCTLGPDCDDNDPAIHEGCEQPCVLTIRPNTFSTAKALFWPIQFFSIRADPYSNISFASPICIYWESEGIDDIFKVRLGEKMIIGLIRLHPSHLAAGTFKVQVTYGDIHETVCGPVEVKGNDNSTALSGKMFQLKTVRAQNKCW